MYVDFEFVPLTELRTFPMQALAYSRTIMVGSILLASTACCPRLRD
jgi:hypothetical protein